MFKGVASTTPQTYRHPQKNHLCVPEQLVYTISVCCFPLLSVLPVILSVKAWFQLSVPHLATIAVELQQRGRDQIGRRISSSSVAQHSLGKILNKKRRGACQRRSPNREGSGYSTLSKSLLHSAQPVIWRAHGKLSRQGSMLLLRGLPLSVSNGCLCEQSICKEFYKVSGRGI